MMSVQTLGCGAHMSQLVREQVGQFDVQSSLTIEELSQAQDDGTLAQKLLETETVLDFLPEIKVIPDYAASIAHGKPLTKIAVMETPEALPAWNEPPGNRRRRTDCRNRRTDG